MKPRLPKRLYRLVVEQGDGEPLHSYEQGSKTYASLPDLKHRVAYHRSKGRRVRVFRAEATWEEVTVAF